MPPGIHKIKHVIIIEQENRSFDSYFGTFPGAEGIPMEDGKSRRCQPTRPPGGHEALPRHGRHRRRRPPRGESNALADVYGGEMNGFIKQRNSTPTAQAY